MLKDLIQRAINVLDQSHPPDQALIETENALSAYLEAIATDRISESVEFEELEHANRLLREVRRERSRRLAESQQARAEEPPVPTDAPSRQAGAHAMNVSPDLGEDDTYDPLKKFLGSSHDPEADSLMDSAEEAFYAGNYQKAISLYEQVMQIEPGWVRAQEHREEAEEFLRTGNIPSVALPPEAGKAYGKAQSAARVFRYQTALDYLQDAFEKLKEAGINRWREGEELRQDLENQMQAQEVYQEGLTMLLQGDLQGGLAKVQTAASAVALPEYVDKAAEIREDIAALEEIADVVNLSGNIPPEKLAEAQIRLDRLSLKYGNIPQINRLRNRMEIVLPAVADSLREEVQRLIHQGDTASTLKGARESYEKANKNLELLQTLQPDTTEGRSLRTSTQDALQEVRDLEDSLQRATQALQNESRFFPRNAYLISKAVRGRFPQDPEVLKLKRRLRLYYVSFYGGAIIVSILVILILWFGGRGIAGWIRQRQLDLTPSPTTTATVTPTATITQIPTDTPTTTPEPSATPDYTATPTQIVTGTVIRTLWARNGCYESFLATGRIPAGAVVTLISQPQREFDELNRECVLVEYQAEDTRVIGYILLLDLQIP